MLQLFSEPSLIKEIIQNENDEHSWNMNGASHGTIDYDQEWIADHSQPGPTSSGGKPILRTKVETHSKLEQPKKAQPESRISSKTTRGQTDALRNPEDKTIHCSKQRELQSDADLSKHMIPHTGKYPVSMVSSGHG